MIEYFVSKSGHKWAIFSVQKVQIFRSQASSKIETWNKYYMIEGKIILWKPPYGNHFNPATPASEP